MERIIYRITLDTHRTGIQRTLQGFETADNMARRISISLVASGDTYEIPMTNVVAMMYVTTPNATEPSVHSCEIKDNTVIYDVENIIDEGITEMQLKLVDSCVSGAKGVLVLPRFAVEVAKSNTDDVGAEQTPTFTALEEAIAKANAVYHSRLVGIEILDDFIFRVNYADGTCYESDVLKPTLSDGNVNMSKSWAVGGVGIRKGEDTDNAKYYSNEAKAASVHAKKVYEESVTLSNDMKLNANYTYFGVNFETGELGYVSTNASFSINKETGELEQERNEPYTPESAIVENAKQKIDEYIEDVELDNEYVDEQIRKLRGDDSEKTVLGAYENANSKLPFENITVVTGSYEHTFDEGSRNCYIYIPFPEGFSKDNSILIGLIFREGETYFWKDARYLSSGNSDIGSMIEFAGDKILLKFYCEVYKKSNMQYKIALLKMDVG